MSRSFDWGNGLGVCVTMNAVSFQTPEAITASRAILSAIKAKGFGWVRLTINHSDHDFAGIPDVLGDAWNTMWNYAALDAMFAALDEIGLRAVVLCSAPQWRRDPAINFADSSQFTYPGPGSPAWDRYAKFFAKIAKRFDPACNKHVWECMNEPNHTSFAIPYPDVDSYLHGLWRFGDIVKGETATIAQPDGVYVMGMTTSLMPIEWFERLAEHPAAQVINAVGPHPYSMDENGGIGWGSGPKGGPTTGPRSADPRPERGQPRNAVAQLNKIRKLLRRAGANKTDIEIISGEWGITDLYTPIVPTDAMTPAYTTTFGTTQLLKNTADLGTLWITEPTASTAITYNGMAGRRLGGQRKLSNPLGHWSALIHAMPNADAVAFGPGNVWYGFRFWARSASRAKIWAGQYQCKANFELTPEWKEYRGAYHPNGAHWYSDGGTSRVFNVATQIAGGEFEVAGMQVWRMSDADIQTAKDAQGAVYAREIVKALKAAKVPLHLHYRWEDLPVNDVPAQNGQPAIVGKGLIEGRYGLIRENKTEKPQMAALLDEWGIV